VNICQLISKIKLKGKFRNKTNVLADREAACVCLKAAVVFSGRSIRWRDTAASIAATRPHDGGSGKGGSNTGKLPMESRSVVLRAADTECGRGNKRNKRPML
jgi:hypothetical protein